jgi:hypothetical protein
MREKEKIRNNHEKGYSDISLYLRPFLIYQKKAFSLSRHNKNQTITYA